LLYNLLTAWFLSIMVSFSPPGRQHFIPEAEETKEETIARYESITMDLAEVVSEEQPLFKGSLARTKTGAVMEAVSGMESGWRKDVDFGLGKSGKGDGGKSWCLMQVNLGVAEANGKTKLRIVVNPDGSSELTTDPTRGWGGEDLVRDRKACFRAGLAQMRKSFNSCKGLGFKDRLRVYAGGQCDRGAVESRARMDLFARWISNRHPTFKDKDVFPYVRSTPLLDPPTLLPPVEAPTPPVVISTVLRSS
jgi:hypothetical protein